MSEKSRFRERLLPLYAPLLVLTLLAMWAAIQILGFGLMWWGIGEVAGVATFSDALYYSGVVYLTLGFELLPYDEAVRRTSILRNPFGPQLEYLIDALLGPRGFWSPDLALGLDDDDYQLSALEL